VTAGLRDQIAPHRMLTRPRVRVRVDLARWPLGGRGGGRWCAAALGWTWCWATARVW